MAVNFAYTLKHICPYIGGMLWARGDNGDGSVGVELLLITDYVYDFSSSNHEFRINDDVLSTLMLASSCICNDTQICCKRQN